MIKLTAGLAARTSGGPGGDKSSGTRRDKKSKGTGKQFSQSGVVGKASTKKVGKLHPSRRGQSEMLGANHSKKNSTDSAIIPQDEAEGMIDENGNNEESNS